MQIDLNHTQLQPKQVACAEHGAYLSSGQVIRIARLQREIWSTCPKCQTKAATQAHLASAEQGAATQQARLEVLLQRSAIPKRFIGCSFDNYRVETAEQKKALASCQRFADNFESHLARGTGLVLAGKPGTGKGHLSAAILQAIMPQYVGLHTSLMDLIHLLREGWSAGRGTARSEAQVLAHIGSLPLLVIDEIGVQFGSAAEQLHLFEVLDRRYRDMKPTILLTNLERDGLKSFVGDRISDRLGETASWVDFSWGSYRLTARKESAIQLEKTQ